jgi:hypothetical protein
VIGLFILLGWAFVGLIVAAVERRTSGDADQAMVTVLCLVGAVAGGLVGQITRLYVFGEPLGFVFSAAGAELLLRFYRARNAVTGPRGDTTPPSREPVPLPSPTRPTRALGTRIAEAFGWGMLCGPALAVSGLAALIIASHLFPQRYSQIPVEFLFVPFGFIVGFVLAGAARLVRPQWTVLQMFGVVAVVTVGYGAFIFNWGRNNATAANVTIAFEPDPVRATPCDSTCPPANPPLQWTVRGRLRVEETAGLGGSVDAIEMTSYTFRHGRLVEGGVQGPHLALAGGQIGGSRRVRPNEPAFYPLKYSYRTSDGDSLRIVSVYVQFTDGAGHPAVGNGRWTVR